MPLNGHGLCSQCLGHKDAWEKAGILHRDISSNNIMFVVDQDQETTTEPYGILNDWDICIRKSDLAMECTQNGRPVSDIGFPRTTILPLIAIEGYLGIHVWSIASMAAQTLPAIRRHRSIRPRRYVLLPPLPLALQHCYTLVRA